MQRGMMTKAARTLRGALLVGAATAALLGLFPAGASATSGVGLDGSGTLYVQSGVDGLDASNAVRISPDPTNTQLVIVDSAGILPPGAPFTADSFTQVRVAQAMVGRISVATGVGDDGVDAGDIGIPIFVDGGAGDDLVIGTGAPDLIKGGLGNDTLDGRGGADRSLGESGDDTLLGSAGNDFQSGGPGTDQLAGGAGNDSMNGESGDDVMAGNAGKDNMQGGDGNDVMRGLSGKDTMRGGARNDRMNGGGGADRMFGQGGDDLLTGAAGQDFVNGGAGKHDVGRGLNPAERRRATLIEG